MLVGACLLVSLFFCPGLSDYDYEYYDYEYYDYPMTTEHSEYSDYQEYYGKQGSKPVYTGYMGYASGGNLFLTRFISPL